MLISPLQCATQSFPPAFHTRFRPLVGFAPIYMFQIMSPEFAKHQLTLKNPLETALLCFGGLLGSCFKMLASIGRVVGLFVTWCSGGPTHYHDPLECSLLIKNVLRPQKNRILIKPSVLFSMFNNRTRLYRPVPRFRPRFREDRSIKWLFN